MRSLPPYENKHLTQGQLTHVTVSSSTGINTILRGLERKGHKGQIRNSFDAVSDYNRNKSDFFASLFAIFFGIPVVANVFRHERNSYNKEEDISAFFEKVLLSDGKDPIFIGYEEGRVDFKVTFGADKINIFDVANGTTYQIKSTLEQTKETLKTDVVKAADKITSTAGRNLVKLVNTLQDSESDHSMDSARFLCEIEAPQQYTRTISPIKDAPAQHYLAMFELKKAMAEKSIDGVRSGMAALENSFAKDKSLKHASLSVTCQKNGDLVLVAHLGAKNGTNKIITIGTFKEKLYRHILPGTKTDHVNDRDILFARDVQS